MITKECNKHCGISDNGLAHHSIDCTHFILRYAIRPYIEEFYDEENITPRLEIEGTYDGQWCKSKDAFLEIGRLHKENKDLQSKLDHAMALLSGPQIENFFNLVKQD